MQTEHRPSPRAKQRWVEKFILRSILSVLIFFLLTRDIFLHAHADPGDGAKAEKKKGTNQKEKSKKT